MNGVDLNCGCPQSWACAETLGAALMNQRELVKDMVVETRSAMEREGWAVGKDKDINNPKGRSVSVKIRVHDDLRYDCPRMSSRGSCERQGTDGDFVVGKPWISLKQ